jgi:electron transport complex protein RnfE
MIRNTRYTAQIWQGLWTSNPALVQSLGLCPLLAVSTTVVNGIGLGLATLVTLVASNVTVSLIRNLIPREVRIPVYVLVIACAVTMIDLGLQAYLPELNDSLGIFIPLIVTNCVIIARAEAFASKNGVGRSFVDAVAMGVGFTFVLVVLGSMRELLGHGTLFQRADLIFGEGARNLTLTLVDDYRGFLLAVLPPGAFIGLGLLIALKNFAENRHTSRVGKQSERTA